MVDDGSSGLFACFQGIFCALVKLKRSVLSRMVSGKTAQLVSGCRRNITVRRIPSCDIRSRDITSASSFRSLFLLPSRGVLLNCSSVDLWRWRLLL